MAKERNESAGSSGKRVIFNTVILYINMIVTMLISLYSVRLVLLSLGAVDYGVFNVIMGVVSMLSFLNAALTVSTQRFLSIYKGMKDDAGLGRVFGHSLLLHIAAGFSVMLLLNISGEYILNSCLQIPADSMPAARIIYRISTLMVFFTFASVPYTAAINANEKMVFIMIVSVVESVEKLILSVYLTVVEKDPLLVYGIGMGCISAFTFASYYFICVRNFEECRHVSFRNPDLLLMRSLGRFAGWNIVGSVTSISKSHGISILFNIFRGPAVNAAYAVTYQASAHLNFFSATMLRSINPQIMQSEGAGNHQRMLRLSNMACKYGFMLLAVFAIPCMFEMHGIMSLWLKEIPEYAVLFCELILAAMMLDQLTVGLNSAFQACDFVRQSAIYVGVVKLMILPVGYVILKSGMPAGCVVFLYALVEFFAGCVRVILAKQLLGMNIGIFVREVVVPLFFPVVVTACVSLVLTIYIHGPFRIFITLPLSGLTFASVSYCSLQHSERMFIKALFVEYKSKLRHGFNTLRS